MREGKSRTKQQPKEEIEVKKGRREEEVGAMMNQSVMPKQA